MENQHVKQGPTAPEMTIDDADTPSSSSVASNSEKPKTKVITVVDIESEDGSEDETSTTNGNEKEGGPCKKQKLEVPIAPGKIKGPENSVSIAVPRSMFSHSDLIKTHAVARAVAAAAISKGVNEIIIYDNCNDGLGVPLNVVRDLLNLLDCPPYLRKIAFPSYPQFVNLDFMSSLERHNSLEYREGIVSSYGRTEDGREYSLVDVGLNRPCKVWLRLKPRIILNIKVHHPDANSTRELTGTPVERFLSQTEAGIYSGFHVRIEPSLSKVFSGCPFRGGYDVTVGTSQNGSDSRLLKPQHYNHLLVVFGGVEGLEHALENDENVDEDDVSKIFHHYVNTCPSQGSRTIRTEEAILISLNALSHFMHK